MPEAELATCYEFGGYRLDTHRRWLIAVAGGQPVRLPPRVLDTLTYFVEHPGELIDKTTLLNAVWPESSAEENSLDKNISILRRALGERPSEHKFIVTVPGRGYRFVAPVRKVAGPNNPLGSKGSDSIEHTGAAVDAQHLYSQARGLSVIPTENNLRGALGLLARATEVDPRMASAWSLMAAVYTTGVQYDYPVDDAIARAEGAAKRAIELNSADGSAFAAMGIVLALRGRYVEADLQFRRAAALPADPFVKGLRCVHVSQGVGHLERAREEALETYRSPVGRQFGATMAALDEVLRGTDREALRWADEAVALGESTATTPQADLRAQLAMRAGRYRDAATLLSGSSSAAVRAAGGTEAIDLLCAALRDTSLRARAIAALRALEERLSPRELDQVLRKRLLVWYTMLGELDSAFGLMDRSLTSYAQRGFVGSAWGVLWLPELQSFRRDPRFQAFARRIGLFDYWETHGPPDGHRLRDGRVVDV